jgi:hypothetical protein
MFYVLCYKCRGLVRALSLNFDYQPKGTVISHTLQTRTFLRFQVSMVVTEHVPGSEHHCLDGDEIMLMMVKPAKGFEETFRMVVEGWPSVQVLSREMLVHCLV